MKTTNYSKKTMLFNNYTESFKPESRYENINFERFGNISKGFLILKLAKNNTTKKLDKFKKLQKILYTLRGLQNPETKGIMLDTTWRLFQHYVVSIPDIIITNIGLPIGFSFGLIEDSDI